MKLSPIIAEIISKCPTFDGRVAGAAEYHGLAKRSNMVIPAAYVIPLDDNPDGQISQTGYRQRVMDGFAVVVVLSQTDPRGQQAYDNLDAIRTELWRCLLGWSPADLYEPIEYWGAALLGLDRSRLDYQFEFYAELNIDQSMTRQGAEAAGLPPFDGSGMGNCAAFESVTINLDHKELPPDGVIDHTLDIPIPQ